MKMRLTCVRTTEVEVLGDISFFPVDDWEFRIWRETKVWIRKADMFEIVVHIAPTRLFICTNHKAHALRYRQSQILDDLQTIVTSYCRAFIIWWTTRIELTIDNLRFVRICVPATTCRHHVHVGKDPELFFPLSKGEMSSIVVHVGCFVAITLSDFQEFLKGFDWSRSIRVSRIRLAVIPFWVNFQEAEKVSHQFFATFFYFCFKVNCCHAYLRYFDLNWIL